MIQRFGGLNSTTPVKDLLSGNAAVDFTLDEMYNVGALPNQITTSNTQFPPPPMNHSGKCGLKASGGGVIGAFTPKLMFVALSDVGKVDVFEIGTGKKIKSIDVPGVSVVTTYWRQ